MVQSWRLGIWLGISALMLSSFIVACGPSGECTVNGDCIDKNGAGYVCSLQNGTKKCVKKAASCPTSCTTNADCSSCTGGNTSCVNGACGSSQPQCPATCTGDADCANCTGGNTSCVGGACSQPAPQCPSSCSADADCANCAGGNTSCVTGTCSTPPGQCPATCGADTDCANCPDNKTSCQNGACAVKPTPPACPSSCSADADCAGCPDNRTACTGGACVPPPQCPSSCSADADCANCASGLNFCISGKCDAKPNPQCPSSCSADADCANCPDNKTTCSNGACTTAQPPQCPSSCSADADCAACPNNRTSCSNGACTTANPPQCPSSCSSNTDCANCPANQQTCVGGQCGSQPPQCPSTCAADADCANCPSGQTTCNQTTKTCGGGSTGTCPAACQTDAECTACGISFMCQQNVCTKTSTNANVGADCSGGQACGAGFICLQVTQTVANCFEDCSSSATTCANNTDGRTNCVQVATDQSTGAPISVCLEEAKKGQKCGFQGALQAQCEANQTPPLYCSAVNGTCDSAVIQKNVGDACNTSTDNTEPIKICDRQLKLACDEQTGKCVTASVAQEGQECDSTGANLGKVVLCDPAKTDLTCIRFDNAGEINRCHYTCNPQAAGQCAHQTGLTCAALLANGGGLCMDLTCTADSDCAWTGYTCDDDGSGGKICFPPQPVGPKKFGEICSTPTKTNGCVSGLFCLTVSGATSGWCSKDCTTAGTTCPSIGTITTSCTQINTNGAKACLVPCGQPGQTCPTNLTCQNVGFQTCLAP